MNWFRKLFGMTEQVETNHGVTLNLGGSVQMQFVWIDALQGWVGKYEVTNRQVRAFKPDHDSGKFEGEGLNSNEQPVVHFAFEDAKSFCVWLNQKCTNQIPSGYKARLPTAAEWGAYAQCGDNRVYPWGDDMPPKYGNYADEAAKRRFPHFSNCIKGYDDGYAVSSPVEKSGKNDWGLFGVGGNVWEWVSIEEDGEEYNGLRGGGWADTGGNLRCDKLWSEPPWTGRRRPDAGFRIVILREYEDVPDAAVAAGENVVASDTDSSTVATNPQDVVSPQSMYSRFINGKTGADIFAAAKLMEGCLAKRDAASDELLELLRPKANVPSTGPSGAPLLDLTGGCPDTPQWIALMAIIDQDNSYYGEYISWIRQNAGRFDRKWIRTILIHLSSHSSLETVRRQCSNCTNVI